MRGLLVKDLRLLTLRKSVILLYLLLAVGFSFYMDNTFAVSYMTMLGGFLAIGTLSYDSFDNGYPFLMTLPITTKTYAVEKHVFCIMVLGFCWILGIALQVLASLAQQEMPQFLEALPIYAVYLLMFLIMISVVLPIELKFGVEKSRIALMVLAGILLLAATLGSKILDPLKSHLNELLPDLSALPEPVIAAGVLLIAVVIIGTGMACSIHVMKHKEF